MGVLALVGGIQTRDVGLVDEGLVAWQQTVESEAFWTYLNARAIEALMMYCHTGRPFVRFDNRLLPFS